MQISFPLNVRSFADIPVKTDSSTVPPTSVLVGYDKAIFQKQRL